MNKSIYACFDEYQQGICTLSKLIRNVLLCNWKIEQREDFSFQLRLAEPNTPAAIQGKYLTKYLPTELDRLYIENISIYKNDLSLLYDYTAILDFEQFLYDKYPNYTKLDLNYIIEYEHFWFVFDADEAYTHTQWLLAPSKEYFFMPAVFTSEDLAEEFLIYPYLPAPEPDKERYTLQTNGRRLLAMLSQMPIDQIAFNPFTSQKTLYISPQTLF